MTCAQIGAYCRLLSLSWLDPDCSVPDDLMALRQLAGWKDSDGDLAPVCACFKPHPQKAGLLRNPRLYREWLEAQAYQSRMLARAKAGAAGRWKPKPSKTLPLDNGRNYLQEADEILTFLNEKTGRVFRGREANGKPTSNLEYIIARLKAGADLQTCKTLIARKVRDWKGDPKMMKFLRPETLFNRTKFESYLGEVQT